MSFMWNTKRMGWNVANEQTTHTTHMQTNTHTHTEKSNFRKDSSLLVIPPPYLTNPPPLFMGKIYFMKIYFIRRGLSNYVLTGKSCVLLNSEYKNLLKQELDTSDLRFRILELENRVTKLSYTKWCHTSSY